MSVFRAQSSATDYIGAEGEFTELNTVERAVKIETDAENRIKRSGQARLVYVKRHKS